MCGIIGVAGVADSAQAILRGLEILEYRGYDSAGIVVVDAASDALWRRRAAERARSLEVLAPLLADAPDGTAIGHTRWATHGGPTEQNAHPHMDCSGRVALVHNGIIENHRELALKLAESGHTLSSETDSEVVAHLVEDELAQGAPLLVAVRNTIRHLDGDFAIAVVSADEPAVLVAARRTSPLIVGVMPGGGAVGSDIAALLGLTRELYLLDDDQVAEVRAGSLLVTTLDGEPVEPHALTVTWDVADAQKDGHPDFMSKEIREQPRAVADTLLGRVFTDGLTDFEELQIASARLAAVERVILVACGSSAHASLVARTAIERWARLPADVDIASEFRFRDAIVNDRTLVIAVSQSGETVDTLHALRAASHAGGLTIALTNVVDSVMAREADGVVYTRAGPEIGVASTKATLAQIAALEAFALHLARLRAVMDLPTLGLMNADLLTAPACLTATLERIAEYEAVGRVLAEREHVFFLGRGTGLPVAMEGALKLKELAYVRAEAYPAGELKHGPIALIDASSVAVAIATDPTMREKVLSNVEEVKARGAYVVAVATDGDDAIADLADGVLYVPAVPASVAPMVDIVPLQCLAYAIARARGNDVDRPRNLAKVVTVE